MIIGLLVNIIMIFAASAAAAAAVLVLIARISNRMNEPDYPEGNVLILIALALGVIVLFYQSFEFYAAIGKSYECTAVVRIADVWLYFLFQLFWFYYIKTFVLHVIPRWFNYFSRMGFIYVFVVSFVAYGFFVNSDYNAVSEEYAPLTTALALTFFLFYIVVNLICIIRIVSMNLSDATLKWFVLPGAIVMLIDNIQFCIEGIKLIRGQTALDVYYSNPVNLLPLIRLVFVALLVIYIIQRWYTVNAENQHFELGNVSRTQKTDAEAIDSISEKYGFTEREKEVATLIKAGMTYDEIAETLYISKNTVKHHINSLYKKTGCSSKVQLINIIMKEESD